MRRPAATATVSRSSARNSSRPLTGLGGGRRHVWPGGRPRRRWRRCGRRGSRRTRAARRRCPACAGSGQPPRARRASWCSSSRARCASAGMPFSSRYFADAPASVNRSPGWPPPVTTMTRRELAVVEIGGVVEARLQHVGRPAVELRGAEHDDRLRRLGVVLSGGVPHLHERDREVQRPRARTATRTPVSTLCRRAPSCAIATAPSSRGHAARGAPGARSRATVSSRPRYSSISNSGRPFSATGDRDADRAVHSSTRLVSSRSAERDEPGVQLVAAPRTGASRSRR